MDPAGNDEQSTRRRKWQSACQRLLEKLAALGLALGQDYFFHGENWQQAGTGIEVRNQSLITADFLVACHQALSEEGEWAALVAIRDPTRNNQMRSIVEISSGLFAAITGGDTTRKAIFEAYHKLGLGHLLSWKP